LGVAPKTAVHAAAYGCFCSRTHSEKQLFQQGIVGQVATFCFWRQPKKPGGREVPPFDAMWGLPCPVEQRVKAA
jgi:hypothetical protein